jgi:hypothetical protein
MHGLVLSDDVIVATAAHDVAVPSLHHDHRKRRSHRVFVTIFLVFVILKVCRALNLRTLCTRYDVAVAHSRIDVAVRASTKINGNAFVRCMFLIPHVSRDNAAAERKMRCVLLTPTVFMWQRSSERAAHGLYLFLFPAVCPTT